MVDALEYDAAMEVCDSDHKPVWARLLVTLPVTRQAEKRRLCSSLLAECYSRSAPEPPRVEISPGTLQLHPVCCLSPSFAPLQTMQGLCHVQDASALRMEGDYLIECVYLFHGAHWTGNSTLACLIELMFCTADAFPIMHGYPKPSRLTISSILLTDGGHWCRLIGNRWR